MKTRMPRSAEHAIKTESHLLKKDILKKDINNSLDFGSFNHVRILQVLDKDSVQLLWRLQKNINREFGLSIRLTDSQLIEKLQYYANKSALESSRTRWRVLCKQLQAHWPTEERLQR